MRISCILFLLLVSHAVFSQRFTVELETGLGTWSMSELSEIMQQSAQQSILKPHSVSDFPPTFFFRPGFGIKGQNHHLGFSLGFYSTGARSAIRDYSGSYHMDMLLRSSAPMLFEEIRIAGTKKVDVALRLNLGMIFSSVSLIENLTLSGESVYHEQEEYVSLQSFLLPELRCNYRLTDSMDAVMGIGYHLGFTPAPVAEQPDSWFEYLKNADREYVETSWNGFRVSLGVQYGF